MVSSLRQTAQKMASEFVAKGITSGGIKAVSGPAGFVNAIAGKISKETLGYNFPGLLSNIGIFYVAALLIDAIFLAIIEGSGFISFIAKLTGKNLPNVLPQQLIDFYKQGWRGFQYWDFVHLTAIVLVATEAYRYIKSNEDNGGKPSYFTLSIFGMIMSAIFLVVGPGLYQKLKEIQNIQSGNTDQSAATYAPPNVGPAWLPTGYSYMIGSDQKYYALVGNEWQQAIQDSTTTGHLSGIDLVRVP